MWLSLLVAGHVIASLAIVFLVYFHQGDDNGLEGGQANPLRGVAALRASFTSLDRLIAFFVAVFFLTSILLARHVMQIDDSVDDLFHAVRGENFVSSEQTKAEKDNAAKSPEAVPEMSLSSDVVPAAQ